MKRFSFRPIGEVTARSLLIATMSAFTIIWLALPKEFIASDPWSYSLSAYNIATHWNFGSANDIFNLRLGVVFPTAVFYALFGINITSTNLWTLCAALLIIFIVWNALPDTRTRAIGLGLCLLSSSLWDSTAGLYPDFVASAFMAASLLLLIRRERTPTARLPWIAICSVGAMFFAFLAKETSYWLLPLWALALFKDRRSQLRLTSFWFPAISAGLVLGLAYLLACHFIWGDALARLKAVNELTFQHLWSIDKQSPHEIIRRMTLGPPQLFFNYYGALFLLGLAGTLVCPREDLYWVYYLLLCIGLFWFGSASFITYEPLPLMARMTAPILPPLLVLGAHITARLTIKGEGPYALSKWAPLVLVFLMMLFSLAPVALGLVRQPLQETRAISLLKKVVNSHPALQYLLITSDRRSPESLKFFFGYRYPRNLRVVAAPDAANELRADDRVYVYMNGDRSGFLTSAYGSNKYPDWDARIGAMKLTKAFESTPVVLFDANDTTARARLQAALAQGLGTNSSPR